MEKQTATDNAGRVYEWLDGRWVLQQADPGVLGTMLINAGERFTNIGAGVQDVAAAVGEIAAPNMMQPIREEIAAEQASNAGLLDRLQEDRPISSFVGQSAPNILAAPLGGSSLIGQMAVEGAIGASEYGTPAERLQRGVLDAALAGGGGYIANRVIRGISGAGRAIDGRRPQVEIPGGAAPPGSAGAAGVEGSVVGTGSMSSMRQTLQNAGKQITGEGIESPADLDALITLRQNDFNLKPGQASGNRASRQIMQSAESTPLLADIMQDSIQNPNQQRFNRMVTEALGDSGSVRNNVFEFKEGDVGRIRSQVGDARRAIEESTPRVAIRDNITDGIRRIQDDFQSSVGVLSKDDPVIRRIDNTLARIDKGSIKTGDLMTMRSDLRGLADTAKLPTESRAYADVIELLDEAFAAELQAGGRGADFEAFQLANQRFRLLEALEKPGVISREGDINAPALARNLRKIFKDEFGENKFGGLGTSGEGGALIERLFNITKALDRFPDVAGRSGTAENLSLQGMFSDPISTGGQLAIRPLLRAIIKNNQTPVGQLEDLRTLMQQAQ
jgi:hypothetical protein